MPITPIGDLLIAIKADVDDYQKSMATAADITAAFKGSLTQLGRTIRNTGAVLTAIGGIMGAASGIIVASTARVNNAFREVATLMNINRSAMEEYRGEVTRLTSQFGVQGGRVETLQSLYQTLSAGFTGAKESVTVLRNALRLSKVGFVNAEDAVENLTKTLNAYGMSADQATKASDILFSVVQFGVVRFEQLNKSLIPILGVAEAAGVKLEQVSAAFARLTQAGLPARRAAFALRSTITKMQKPSAALAGVLTKIAQEGMVELEGAVKKTLTALNTEQQKLNEIDAELRQQQQELSATQQKYNELGNELNGLKNQFDDLSDSMRDNRIKIKEIRLAAQKEGRELTNQEKERIDELQLKNEELRLQQMKMERKMDNVREKRQKVNKEMEKQEATIDKVKKKREEQQATVDENAKQLEKYAGSISTALIEQEGFVDALNIMIERGEEAGVPLQEMFNNVRAYSAIIKLAGKNTDEYKETLNSLKENAGVTQRQMHRFNDSIGFKFRQAVQNLKQIFQDFGQSLIKSFLPVIEDINGILKGFKSFLSGLSDDTKNAAAQFFMLGTAFALIAGPLMFVVGSIITMVGILGTGLIPVLGAAALATGGLAATFNKIRAGGQKGEEAIQNFKDAIQSVIDGIQNFVDIIDDELLPGIIEFGQGIKEWIDTAISTIRDLASEGNGLSNTFEDVSDSIGILLQKVGKWLKANSSMVEGFIRASAAIIRELVPGIRAIIVGLIDIAKVVTGVIFKLASMANLGGSVSAIVPAIVLVASAIGDLLQWIGTFMQKNAKLIGIITAVVGGMLLLAEAIVVVAGVIGTISTAIGVVTAFLGALNGISAVMLILAGLGSVLGPVISALASISAAVGTIISTAGTVAGVISTIASVVVGVATTIVGILGGPLTVAILAIIGLITLWETNMFGFRDKVLGIIDYVVSGFWNLYNGTKRAINSAINAVRQFVMQNKKWFSILGGILLVIMTGPIGLAFLMFKNNVFGIRDAAVSAIKAIVGAFRFLGEVTNKLITGAVTAIQKGIAVWTSVGKKLVGIMKKNARKTKQAISSAFSTLASFLIKTIIDPFLQLREDIIDAGMKLVDWYISGAKEGARMFANMALDVLDPILTPIRNLADSSWSWGKNLVEEFALGIKDTIPKVTSAVDGIASEVESYIGIFSNAKKGPLSTLEQWGPNLTKEYASGIKSNKKKAVDAAKEVGKDVKSNMPTSADVQMTPKDQSGFAKAPGSGLVPTGGKSPTKQIITIEEGAVKILPGAFEGITEEELPGKVGEEIEMKFEEIVDLIESQGKGQ